MSRYKISHCYANTKGKPSKIQQRTFHYILTYASARVAAFFPPNVCTLWHSSLCFDFVHSLTRCFGSPPPPPPQRLCTWVHIPFSESFRVECMCCSISLQYLQCGFRNKLGLKACLNVFCHLLHRKSNGFATVRFLVQMSTDKIKTTRNKRL